MEMSAAGPRISHNFQLMVSRIHRRRVLLVLMLVVVAGGAGFVVWRHGVIDLQQDRAAAMARKALDEGDARLAYALVREWQPRAQGPERQAGWQAIEIATLARLGAVGKLWQREPSAAAAVAANEDASLLVARCAIHQHQAGRAKPLIAAWSGKSTRPEAWLALAADAFILAGQADQARDLLEKVSFPPDRDGGRKCRLAMLQAATDPQAAWKTLTDASRDNPRHPETRLFRGQFLEAMGRQEAASVEYLAARLAAPENPFFLDQLAEFHLRRGNPAGALEVWQQGLKAGAPDFLWLKTAFWSRLVVPVKVDWSGIEEGSGPLCPLARAIALQPEQRFWNERAVTAEQTKQWKGLPELYWLMLLDKLQAGNDAGAWQDMQCRGLSPSSRNPGLEAAIGRLLTYRMTGSLVPLNVSLPRLSDPQSAPGVFRELESLADRRADPAAPLAEFLRSPEAIPTLVAAAGWMEAAVRLGADRAPSRQTPAWARYTMAQAVRFARGPAAALSLVAAAPADPSLTVMRGELLLATGDTRGAVAAWQSVAADATAVGRRAAWFLATLAIEQNRPADVQAALGPHAASLLGKELLGRAALLDGRVAEATTLYSGIAGQSPEARAFLARQALAAGDTGTAARLANELAVEFPDSRAARTNMLRLGEHSATPNPQPR